ncbi:MAG: PAS domain-containing methyl-accepting chemotaxis protein [Rhodocyclaceae bacterium]|nr:PAS domain-containing methyl-accepting chemotaxis protein [Rhodocyclaceae bacterium]MDZ4214921.1 PAS domain-containing methyl-accepting chemotaxis protein [Rhodocyclaceae bacterium]
MKNNGPVTQREAPFPRGKYLVSKTDLKGIITYCNDAFIELSGFTKDELIGKSHNIVRHPDMPPAAFGDLWETVKSGRPWRGFVKNRCKEGDHYWVEAFVVPLRKDGQTIGYMSVRSEPSREGVRQAEALYQQINAGRAKLPKTGGASALGVQMRMQAVLGALALMLAILTGVAFVSGDAGLVGTLGAVFTLAGGLLMTVGGLLTGSIVKPMRKAVDHFERISEGILTDDIDTSGRGEPGQLMCALAAMQVHLKVILDEVRQVSLSLDEESQRLSRDMSQVVNQSLQQQDRVQGTAAATEELTQSVAEVASSVDSTANAASRSKKLVTESTRSMDSSMEATSRVVGAVQASSATIGDLNRAIEKIGQITNTIREIAEQTNLLALNAAIEAARAGEQGRGFAVVADEVRKLAERTATSTTDINNTVGDFQSVTQKAVSSMEQAAREVEQGIALMRTSVAGLEQIRESSDEVASMADTIASASREQAIASQDVAVNMEQVSSLIEQNTMSAQSALHSAEELALSASALRNMVAQFRLVK